MTTLVDLAARSAAAADNDAASDRAPAPAPLLPERRPDLLIRPIGDNGNYVVKDPRTGEYFSLGAQEQFLLVGLDGRQTADALRAAFERRFGEPLSADDLAGFVGLASAQGFLRTPATAGGAGAGGRATTHIDYGTDGGVAAPVPSRPPRRAAAEASASEPAVLAQARVRPRPLFQLARAAHPLRLDARVRRRLVPVRRRRRGRAVDQPARDGHPLRRPRRRAGRRGCSRGSRSSPPRRSTSSPTASRASTSAARCTRSAS